MNALEHYREAEKLLERGTRPSRNADEWESRRRTAPDDLTAADVHARLAAVAQRAEERAGGQINPDGWRTTLGLPTVVREFPSAAELLDGP